MRSRMPTYRTVLLAVSLAAAPLMLGGQEPPIDPGVQMPESVADVGSFGLGQQDYWVSALGFRRTSGSEMEYSIAGYLHSLGASVHRAPLPLPAGAHLEGMICYFFDDDPAEEASVQLAKLTYTIPGHVPAEEFIDPPVTSLTTGGFFTVGADLDTTIRYREGSQTVTHYSLRLVMTGSSQVAFRGCRILWKRQTSVPTGTPTFSDVGVLHPYYRFVEALAAAGITGGCGGGLYCVNAPITRGEMAVFLAAALGLHFPY